MKRTLSLLLVLAMVLSSFGFAFAAEDKVTPAEFLNKEGILKGNASGDLMLEDNLKRQDMIVMLSRLLGVEDEAKVFEGKMSFTDVTDKFYVPYIAWAEAKELTNGKATGKFGFDEPVTVQQVAQFMLRALNYGEVKWEEVPAKAVELKLVEKDTDLTVDAKRSVLAEITYRALETKMKDSDKTLAKFLGIEMPVVEVKELKVEKVETENLSEINVVLSNAKLVDKEKLEDVNNYKLTGYKVEKAIVEENTVILLLNDGLAKGKKYELVVRNIDKAINKTYKFTAEDNTLPEIEKVEILGGYGIKVITSEPIKNPQERNFLIDGKNIAMDLEQYGRVIVLTPYYDKEFPENAKTLTVKPLADFAGFKSTEKDLEIEMIKDEVAPEVTDVVVKGNVVEVTFDKDIYADSVYGYYNRKTTGNVSYKDGRQTIYTVQYGGEKVDVNKARYEFDREIPRRAEITIEGVANHSNVEMKKVTTEGRIVVDYSEPVLIDSKKYDYVRAEDGKSGLTIALYFDKNVSGKFVNPDEKDAEKLRFDAEYHFDLYQNDVIRGRRLTGKTSDYIKSVKYGLDKDNKVRKDVVVVELTGLNVNNRNKDFEYVLELRDFTDVTSFRNRMYRDYVDFNIPKSAPTFEVESIKMVEGRVETEIAITFNLPVDRAKAENLSNYLFRKGNTTKDLEELDGKVIVEKSGYTVTLVIPEFNSSKYETLEILETLKEVYYDGRLDGQRVFNLVDLKAGVNTNANKVIKMIDELPKLTELKIADKEKVEKAKKAYDDLEKAERAYISKEKYEKLTNAEAKMKDLVAADEKNKGEEAKKTAVKAINEATNFTIADVLSKNAETLGLDLTVFNTLKDKTPVYQALVATDFEDMAAVQTAFNKAVADQKVAEEPTVAEYTATGDITAITPDTVKFAEGKFTAPAGVTEFTFKDGEKEMKATFADGKWNIAEATVTPDPEEATVEVTFVASLGTMGKYKVVLKSGAEKATKYSIIYVDGDGTEQETDKFDLGTETTAYAKNEKVTVKLFDAENKLVDTVKDVVVK